MGTGSAKTSGGNTSLTSAASKSSPGLGGRGQQKCHSFMKGSHYTQSSILAHPLEVVSVVKEAKRVALKRCGLKLLSPTLY